MKPFILFGTILLASACSQHGTTSRTDNVHQFGVPPVNVLIESEADYALISPFLVGLPQVISVAVPDGGTRSYSPGWRLIYPDASGNTDTIKLYQPVNKKAGVRYNDVKYHEKKLREFRKSFSAEAAPTDFADHSTALNWVVAQSPPAGKKLLEVDFGMDKISTGISPDSLSTYLNSHYSSATAHQPITIIISKSEETEYYTGIVGTTGLERGYDHGFTSQAQLPMKMHKLKELDLIYPTLWRISARRAEVRKVESIGERYRLLIKAADQAIASGEADLMLDDLQRLIPGRYAFFKEKAPRHLEAIIVALQRRKAWLAHAPVYLTLADRRGTGKQVLIVSNYRSYTNSHYKFSFSATTDRFGRTTLHVRPPGENHFQALPLERNKTVSISWRVQGYPHTLYLTDLGYQEDLHDIHFDLVPGYPERPVSNGAV